jgi:hypothetical protein
MLDGLVPALAMTPRERGAERTLENARHAVRGST